MEKIDFLSKILIQDHGRTIGEAKGTLQRCIENIESACSALLLLTKGEYVNDLAKGLDQTLFWEPKGVFLIITPNNIPMHAWSSYVPYAIASGCPVIVSPSNDDPLSTKAIFEVIHEVKGFPKGLINLLYGGPNINDKILSHSHIKGVGFIGSTTIGRKIFARAGELGKEASINGNGKNHVVLMKDININKIVNPLLRGCYGMTGQRCLGADNLLIQNEVYDEFKQAFVKALKAMKIGYGLNETTELGPLVSKKGYQKPYAFFPLGSKNESSQGTAKSRIDSMRLFLDQKTVTERWE